MSTDSAKHTPGEWVKSTLCHTAIATDAHSTEWQHGSGNVSEHPLPVADFSSHISDHRIPDAECEANRDYVLHVLKSHDSMLSALKAAEIQLVNCVPVGELHQPNALQLVRAAISKAEEVKS